MRSCAWLILGVLHRILHRFCEVIIGHLQVMFGGNSLRVANPCANDVKWINFRQLSLSCTAEILK